MFSDFVALECSEVWCVGMGQYETVPISQFHSITVIALKCLILKFLGKKTTTFFTSIEHNLSLICKQHIE